MTEFKIGNPVLVPGKVIGYDSDGYLLVAFVGAELEFRPTDLRPDQEGADTGRPITADDVREAVNKAPWTAPHPWDAVAEYLNRIARGGVVRQGDIESHRTTSVSDSEGADAPVSGTGEQVSPKTFPQIGDRARITTGAWVGDVGTVNHFKAPVSWLLVDEDGDPIGWYSADELELPDRSPRSWSLPAPPPDDVTVVHIPEMYELQGGPELYRADDEDGLWWGPDGALWEWSQMLGNGTVVEGEPPAPEPVFAVGDRVRVKSSGRTGVLREVDARGRHLIFGDNESWIVGVRADNLEPAPEPQAAEPPRFERGFYRLARDLDVRGDAVPADAEVIVHGPIGRGLLWVSQLYSSGDDVCGAISAAALAAAGAERVEER
ncbi:MULTISPECIES: hypothetical protein [Pseudonocardia]|uniref:Uncharacterized protein n=2 Tax=Pseudonocardia TaxID=1847 RepID=A0A1Y2MLG0_PSEAH|nr:MULTISPECIES: hypothetical protein [Pseudonocardia]OSY36104.1 hypothetical protein BG845_05619 [Pseudonocardia autotrophica]TDN77586.1 hypothetical protein C8E95_6835 [Pseudonocardia autotrophica]BBG01616.1 hypothetical protein Pdca_28250 [Pseudonocardia autotrophica]GEC25361.1 hypothetical protein PSA01_23900 [Pseudonocardia saturnea]